MDYNIDIRKAYGADAEGIYEIYEFWNNSFIDNDQDKKYFVLKNNFTLDQIKHIVNDGFATVAIENSKVVSFYFLNPYYDTGNLEVRKQVINKMVEQNVLPDGEYAFSLLSSTRENYTGKGLNNKTLHLLRELLKTKYDYFIGVMNYNNKVTHVSAAKMGWKLFGDIGIGLLVIIGTTDENDNKLNP